ncbi:MAG: amidase [Bauldia sp.]
MSGKTIAVKDLLDIAGRATGGGNPDWAKDRAPAAAHAAAVDRLLAAGATIVGKTITDELAFSLEGRNHHYGTPLNPRAPGRIPGGSSSGSAAAVAAGLAEIGLGTDTGGSVRVPASFCGLFGFRPTHGRVPMDGVIPFAPSYDTVGWMTDDAELLRAVGRVLLQSTAQAPPIIRLLIAEDAFAIADRPVADAVRAAISGWPIAGTTSLFAGEGNAVLEGYRVLQGFEIWRTHGAWIERERPRFGPGMMERFVGASAISLSDADAWRPWRERFRARMRQALAEGTAIILPTVPVLPLRLDALRAEVGDFYRRALALGAVAGHAGLPQVTLPIAALDGIPVGVSLIAAPGCDEALLDLALALTEARR